MGSPRAISLGIQGEATMLASPPPSIVSATFFRLQQRSLNDPLDSDGDGIDDVYELRHAPMLNPVDATDAGQAPPGGSLTYLQSYRLVKAAVQTRGFSNLGRRFAASAQRVVAIRDDGTLWGWGKNEDGRVGDGTEEEKTSPVRIGSGSEWVAVSASAKHSLALRSDGSIWAWGANEAGQLGFSDLQPRLTPTPLPGNSEWKAISAGGSQTLAIQQDGTLWVWGGYGRGPTAATKVDDSKTWRTAAAAVISFGLAIKDDGTLWLIPGEGSNPLVGAKPPSRLGNASNWVEVAVGFGHYLAIDKDRRLITWGDNTFGQLGDGTHTARKFANRVDLGVGWNSISAGAFSSLAVKQEGTLWFFGGNLDSGAVATSVPVQIGAGHSWSQASSQDLGIVAADTKGILWGLPPTPGTMNQFKEGRVIGTDDDWQTAIEGDAASFGIKKDGRAYAWGWNDSGQLGVGLQTNRVVTPQPVGADIAWESISPHPDYTVGVSRGGEVYAWGNVLHVLGASVWDTNILRPTLLSSNAWPVDIPPGQTNAVGLAHYIRFAPPTNQPAARPELTLWGENQFGQLGNNSRTPQTIENPVNLGINWSEVAAAGNYSLAKDRLGNVYGWGELLPLLGGPTVPICFSPVRIDHRFAPSDEPNSPTRLQIRENGELWASGENQQGQIGDGTTETRNSQVPVVAYQPARPFHLGFPQGLVDLQSVDRLVRGTVDLSIIPPGTKVALEITYTPIGASEPVLFRYSDLLGENTSAKMFPDEDSVLGESDDLGDAQETVFVFDGSEGKRLLKFYQLFDSLGIVRVKAQVGEFELVLEQTLVHEPEPAALLNSIDERIHSIDAPPEASPENKGFFSRVLSCKAALSFFDTLRSGSATALGGIDGVWSGAKGDAQTLQALADNPASVVKETLKGIAILLNTQTASVFKQINNAYESYLHSAQERLSETGIGGIYSDNYIQGNIAGFGVEQIATGVLTAGIGRAVLSSFKATAVGATIVQGISKAKQFSNGLLLSLSRSKFSRADLRAWQALGNQLEQEMELIEATLQQASIGKNVIAEELSKYGSGNLEKIGAGTVRRLARISAFCATELTEDALRGFLRAQRRMLNLSEDVFETLFSAFDGDAKRLSRALADYADDLRSPDIDLLEFLYTIDPKASLTASLDHKDLLLFFERVDALTANSRITEALAAVRHEVRTGERLARKLPANSPWDFDSSTGTRIDFKGPVLQNGGVIYPPEYYSRSNAEMLVMSVKAKVSDILSVTDPLNQANAIVVDTFGFGVSEQQYIQAALAEVQSATSIIIHWQ